MNKAFMKNFIIGKNSNIKKTKEDRSSNWWEKQWREMEEENIKSY